MLSSVNILLLLKKSVCVSCSVVSSSLQPHGLQPARFLCPWDLGLPFPSPGDLPAPGTELRSPALQADSSPSEPPGKPKNTGVGSLPFSRGSSSPRNQTQGLLHCRRILYQLSYQGSPIHPLAHLICDLLRKTIPPCLIWGIDTQLFVPEIHSYYSQLFSLLFTCLSSPP